MKKSRIIHILLSALFALSACTLSPSSSSYGPASAKPSVISTSDNGVSSSSIAAPASWVKSDYDMRKLLDYSWYVDGAMEKGNVSEGARYIKTEKSEKVFFLLPQQGSEPFGLGLFPYGGMAFDFEHMRVYLVKIEGVDLPVAKTVISKKQITQFELPLFHVQQSLEKWNATAIVRTPEEAILRLMEKEKIQEIVRIVTPGQSVYYAGKRPSEKSIRYFKSEPALGDYYEAFQKKDFSKLCFQIQEIPNPLSALNSDAISAEQNLPTKTWAVFFDGTYKFLF